jgi:hypothetical protein
VAPGEDEERGRLATKRTRPSGGDEEDPDADTGPACELKLESREGKNRSGGERRIHRRSSSEKKGEKDRWLTRRSWAWSERTGVAAGGEFWRRAVRKTATIRRLEGVPACATRREEHVEHRGAIRGLGSA